MYVYQAATEFGNYLKPFFASSPWWLSQPGQIP